MKPVEKEKGTRALGKGKCILCNVGGEAGIGCLLTWADSWMNKGFDLRSTIGEGIWRRCYNLQVARRSLALALVGQEEYDSVAGLGSFRCNTELRSLRANHKGERVILPSGVRWRRTKRKSLISNNCCCVLSLLVSLFCTVPWVC